MAQTKKYSSSAARTIRLTIGILTVTVIGGYFLYRQADTFKDEIVFIIQLGAITILYTTLMKRLILPLWKIFSVAEKINTGDLSQRFEDQPGSYYHVLTASNNLLLERIKHASDFINHIEKGNLDVEFELMKDEEGKQDMLAQSLTSMRDQMRRIETENQERNWGTQGLAKFIEILRANDEEIAQLGDKIISNLTQYLEANQAALFILNEDKEEKNLEMVACYAYNRKKFLNKTIKPGEGLAGQAYLEKETIYITQLPEHYVNITSGLGQSSPRSAIVVPLKINGQVFGILEMASFKEFKKYQIDFLEKLGESIASTIATTKTTQKTKALLEESQQQAEEMRAQEEEMRQNMEELQATQEQQDRLRTELNEKVQQLEQAKIEIEKVQEIEKRRAEEQIEKRNKIMQQTIQKFKAKEKELLEKLKQANID